MWRTSWVASKSVDDVGDVLDAVLDILDVVRNVHLSVHDIYTEQYRARDPTRADRLTQLRSIHVHGICTSAVAVAVEDAYNANRLHKEP